MADFVDDLTREAEAFVDRVWAHVVLTPEQKVYVCQAIQARISMRFMEQMRQTGKELDDNAGDD